MVPEPSYYIKDVSQILGIEKSAIYRLIKNKKLETNKCRPITVRKTHLQSFVLDKAPKAS